jgi:SSS family solute:Na+ symporter
VLMTVLLGVSLFLVARYHGGFVEANEGVMAKNIALFSRPGGLGKYTPAIWFSYIILWFFCDPMFPQLFQRFFSAKSERTISRMMLFYPAICTLVFFMPIAVGLLGRLSFPNLVGKEADRILPMVVTLVSGDIMAALIIACGLAALMSTMDSQLLTLSSIFTRDVAPLITGKKIRGNILGRVFVIFLSLAGLALAYKPPATILQIATQTFTGLAVLFPTVIFGLYLRRVWALPAILSILCGEGMVILYYFKLLPTGGFLPVIPVMIVTFAVYLSVHGFIMWREGMFGFAMPAWLSDPYFYLILGIFILSMDFWAWGRSSPQLLGVPLWMGYFVILSTLQTIIMVKLINRRQSGA